MRRRLEQLLNGRFEYEVPHLLLSETEVALTLDEGQNFRGELNIGAEDGRSEIVGVHGGEHVGHDFLDFDFILFAGIF